MFKGLRWLALVIGGVLLSPLGGCDQPPPQAEHVLKVAKADNAMDEAIRKSSGQSWKPPAAKIDLSPAAIDFPAVGVGGSASRTIEVANGGDLAATITQIHVVGQSASFRLGGDCVAVTEIAAGHGCSIVVTFEPQSEGPASAELVMVLGDVAGLRFIPLAGLGKGVMTRPAAARPPTPNAELSLAFVRSRQAAGLELAGAGAGGGAPAADPAGLSAPDYTDAGLPGIVSSLPVDRHRVITADRYIPAVLENDIDSQLPGRTIAVVESNVYGSQGRTVLIPAGARVIGSYQVATKAGQARLEVNWSRVIRPDGVTINIDDVSADVMGRSGLPGDLDSRVAEKYGGSLLTSVVAAAGDWALNGQGTTVLSPLGGTTQTQSGKQIAANRLGNDLDDLGKRMIQDNFDIRPVLLVAAGTRLNIIPAQDIWLQDPRHMRAVTQPMEHSAVARVAAPATSLLPGLVELAAQNPTLARLAPQTTQQIMQSDLLQQLRDGNYSLPAAPGGARSPPATGRAP